MLWPYAHRPFPVGTGHPSPAHADRTVDDRPASIAGRAPSVGVEVDAVAKTYPGRRGSARVEALRQEFPHYFA